MDNQPLTMADSPDTDACFNRNLEGFQAWKARLKKLIVKYYAWLKTQDAIPPDIEEQLRSSLDALNRDEITLALVSEVSRGKSNLVNAIFFPELGRQFLPSAAGRTTMCTVEIQYDQDRPEPCLRLLPIETLLEKGPLSSFKDLAAYWHSIPLDLEDKDRTQEVLLEIRKIRLVSMEEAGRLGLVWEQREAAEAKGQAGDVQVEIPKWRHALLNLPHPLMMQGLRVIDTPGLNALGSEPELMLRILPSAQVILFVLGADTGVTQSDLRIWKQHVQPHQLQWKQKVLVVLNKVDSLWNELNTAEENQRNIDRQRADVARILGLPPGHVFAVSAHKALVARIKGEDALLRQTGLPDLELYLFQELFEGRWRFLTQTLCASLEQMLVVQIQGFEHRLGLIHRQRTELFELSNKSSEMLVELSNSLQLEEKQHVQVVEGVRSRQQALRVKAQELDQVIGTSAIHELIGQAQIQMHDSWTSFGLKKATQALFDRLNAHILDIGNKVEEIRDLLLELYRWLRRQDDYRLVQPRSFSIIKYRVALDKLYQEAESFCNSPQILLLGKSALIERFLNALVQQAKEVFDEIAHEARSNWVNLALEPILYQARDHKDMLDRKGLDLQKIVKSREALAERIKELYAETARTKAEIARLQQLRAENAQLLSSPVTGGRNTSASDP